MPQFATLKVPKEPLQGLKVWGSQPSQSAEFKFFASGAVNYKKAENRVAVFRIETQGVNLSS
jgi:hypothetical protein